jgi:hypothetical protein
MLSMQQECRDFLITIGIDAKIEEAAVVCRDVARTGR